MKPPACTSHRPSVQPLSSFHSAPHRPQSVCRFLGKGLPQVLPLPLQTRPQKELNGHTGVDDGQAVFHHCARLSLPLQTNSTQTPMGKLAPCLPLLTRPLQTRPLPLLTRLPKTPMTSSPPAPTSAAGRPAVGPASSTWACRGRAAGGSCGGAPGGTRCMGGGGTGHG